jgi:hypothetical protein
MLAPELADVYSPRTPGLFYGMRMIVLWLDGSPGAGSVVLGEGGVFGVLPQPARPNSTSVSNTG